MEKFTSPSRLAELCGLKEGGKMVVASVQMDVQLRRFGIGADYEIPTRRITKITLSEGKRGKTTLKIRGVFTNNMSDTGQQFDASWYMKNETEISWYMLTEESLNMLQDYLSSIKRQ